MQWICFGDSVKGALKAFSTFPHIMNLSDDLSIGDLSDLQDQKKRAFSICPWKDDPEFADEAGTYIGTYFQDALPALKQVENAVIWYGETPFEQCGMLRAAHDLFARGVPFSLVHVDRLKGEELPPKEDHAAVGAFTNNLFCQMIFRYLPQGILRKRICWHQKQVYQERHATEIIFRGVGECGPEELAAFYHKKRKVLDCEAKLLYSRWERLVAENAPLRVLENGKVVSASEDYYDAAILSNTSERETSAAMVIGRTLGEYAVNDYLIFERIRKLAACGKLEIVINGRNYRETTVKRLDNS